MAANTPHTPASPTLDAVVEALTDDVVADYRIGRDEAQELLAPQLAADAKLRKALAKAPDLGALQRMRAYRDARKKARKAVYYTLRQYKRATPSGDDLPTLVEALRAAVPTDAQESPGDAVERATQAILEAHSSTRERLDGRASFDRQLLAVIGTPRSIVDVGGGVYPLMFPFRDTPQLERYLALDRDAAVTEAVAAFATASTTPPLEGRLEARRWDIGEGWDAVETPSDGLFDVALLFKVVPVVARQEPALLDVLAATPARRLVVSGSRVALTKKADIESRERALLRRWIDAHGFRVIEGEIVVDEEFALVLER